MASAVSSLHGFMMHCATKATPFQFIDSSFLNSCRTNHTWLISYFIMPLVINVKKLKIGNRLTVNQLNVEKHSIQSCELFAYKNITCMFNYNND